MENSLLILANGIEAIMEAGFTGKEPFLNENIMREFAKEQVAEMESEYAAFEASNCSLSTEDGRKKYRSIAKPYKQVANDSEKNLKTAKKYLNEIPRQIDIISRALRSVFEPAFERRDRPFAELKAQEALTEKWWKKEGIPFDKFSLERLLKETKDARPVPHSTPEEAAEFEKHKAGYLKAVEEALNRILLAEKAEREEKERQAKEAERLRLLAAEQRREAERQQREREALEAEQRKVAEEQRRVAAEAAELERRKQAAAVNPAISAELNKGATCLGAPSADDDDVIPPPPNEISFYEENKNHREAASAIRQIIDNGRGFDGLANVIVAAIQSGQIPHVRFVYE